MDRGSRDHTEIFQSLEKKPAVYFCPLPMSSSDPLSSPGDGNALRFGPRCHSVLHDGARPCRACKREASGMFRLGPISQTCLFVGSTVDDLTATPSVSCPQIGPVTSHTSPKLFAVASHVTPSPP
ncbi:hypothetical protein Q7C36_019547 [Tachysurus vachellii]|uniref:Uncharacterized protein n=1 Tax=Tachysurus vachellii TaxID=175792 RepID=A0AA88LWP5_TACVA|nr:hypothetical protein Q7C36_019547 [Tachysurus vachellii]